MPSTYSTNLGLELIGASEQSGTWGNTTNTNIGTLLEQAVSGYTTQAISDVADTTITIPNGASGVARNMTIEMTGTLTAARNLIVPANKKLYFVYNNTTGGYAVTVKVSGQTGVSVPAGAKVLLVSNGTDVVSAINYLASLTLGAALPVASGGTGLTAVGTSGNVLTSNGTAWVSSANPPAFASGTRLVFQQTSAPTGWTKDTNATYNDSAIRITTGSASTGGADAFTTLFGTSKATASASPGVASHSHTYSATSGGQSANHYHNIDVNGSAQTTWTRLYNGGDAAAIGWAPVYGGATGYETATVTTSYALSDHTHTTSGTTDAAGSGSAHTHTLSNMNLKYSDCIIAQKD